MEKQAPACDALMAQIIDLEWEMFSQVKSEGKSVCQGQPGTFRRMRRMSHSVLSTAILQSYLADLLTARKGGRNLMTEKYARMQRLIPPLKENPLIGNIVDVEIGWLRELTAQYPRTFTRALANFCDYARCELETYSDQTLHLYWAHVKKALRLGLNLVRERYVHLFGQMGMGRIEDVESGLAARAYHI